MQEIEQVEPPSVVISTDAVTDKDKDEKHGLALCLSGGGYRAALFHLGVLRCLHEMGILQTVSTVSSVSGGSIISAYIAKRMFDLGIKNQIQFNDWEQDISVGFREFVKRD